MIGADHCSAIIKLLPDMSDVVFGHDTWDSYQTAYPRVFKHFKYNRMKGWFNVDLVFIRILFFYFFTFLFIFYFFLDSVPIRKDMNDC